VLIVQEFRFGSVFFWHRSSFGAGALARFVEAVRGVYPVTERSVVVRSQPQVDPSLDFCFAKVASILFIFTYI
jgi:hypothetical protein